MLTIAKSIFSHIMGSMALKISNFTRHHKYLNYSNLIAAIYSNMGNYKGFGDSKFVPDLKPDQFETILKNSKAWADDTDGMSEIWESCKSAMW